MIASVIQFITGEFYIKIGIDYNDYRIPRYDSHKLFETAYDADTFLKDFILSDRYREVSNIVYHREDEWVYKIYEQS